MYHRLILLLALCLFSKLSFAADPFNTALFESIIHDEMRGKAKGYAFVIANRDGFQSRVVGGWAQDPTDGNVRMSTKMPSCIGSVSKMLSGTALANTLFDAFVRATRSGGSNPVYHGMTAAKYQQVSEELAEHGTRISRFDFYEAGGKVFVNARFTPAKGKDWVAKHNQTAAEYQALFTKYLPKGYRPTWVDSYQINGKTRYALVMIKENNSNVAKHGLTAAQFQEQLKSYRRDNYEPLVVSGVGTSNGRRFTVLARPKRGDWEVKGAVPVNKLKEVIDDSAEKGLYPHSIDAYRINGEQRYAVVFRERAKPIRYKGGLSAGDYQGFYDGITARGYRVTAAVGYVADRGQQRFGMLYAQQ